MIKGVFGVEIPLEVIEALRRKANLTYRQARDILQQTGGDLLEALVHIEENSGNKIDEFSERGKVLYQHAKNVAGRLHQTRVKINVKDKTLVELPVTVSALGAALFPKLAALGMIGLLFSSGSIQVNGGPARADAGTDHGDSPPETH